MCSFILIDIKHQPFTPPFTRFGLVRLSTCHFFIFSLFRFLSFYFVLFRFFFVLFRFVSFRFVSQDFVNGNFLAVQWRTETATGVMADCYEEVR